MSKGSLLHKGGKGAHYMTSSELILKLVEMILTEREKSINLQSKLEENKKNED